jgi:competence protein ComEC
MTSMTTARRQASTPTKAARVGLFVSAFMVFACATDREDEIVPRKRTTSRVVIESEPPESRGPVLRDDDTSAMRLHLLDVGQGSATLLEFPCAAVLVDTGGEKNALFDGVAALTRELDAFFVSRPDLEKTLALVIITHPHIDHLRGLPAVLERYRVLNIVDDGLGGDDLVAKEMKALRTHADAAVNGSVGYRAIRTEQLPEGRAYADDVVDPVNCGSVDPQIQVLWGGVSSDPGWGENRYGHAHFENANNHSVVVRVDFGRASALITGDLEDVGIRSLLARVSDRRLLDADVYIVGHHGSFNGTTRALLEAVTPEIALISMGSASREISWSAWQYGHPRKDIVDILTGSVRRGRQAVTVPVARGARRFDDTHIDRAIYGTGWDGTVVVRMLANGAVLVEDLRARGEPAAYLTPIADGERTFAGVVP